MYVLQKVYIPYIVSCQAFFIKFFFTFFAQSKAKWQVEPIILYRESLVERYLTNLKGRRAYMTMARKPIHQGAVCLWTKLTKEPIPNNDIYFYFGGAYESNTCS
jgi:hypothetical protein